MNDSPDYDPVADLSAFLGSSAPGPVPHLADPERFLNASWSAFEGNEVEGMSPDKLIGRIERVEWLPPVLTFVIERHGRTCLGSTRADLHRWTLDLEARTAIFEKIGHRQLRPTAPRLDIRRLAQEIAGKIVREQVDKRLRWHPDGTVRVLLSAIFPVGSGYKQTVEGRRKRFKEELIVVLEGSGWRHLGRWLFAPATRTNAPKLILATRL